MTLFYGCNLGDSTLGLVWCAACRTDARDPRIDTRRLGKPLHGHTRLRALPTSPRLILFGSIDRATLGVRRPTFRLRLRKYASSNTSEH